MRYMAIPHPTPLPILRPILHPTLLPTLLRGPAALAHRQGLGVRLLSAARPALPPIPSSSVGRSRALHNRYHDPQFPAGYQWLPPPPPPPPAEKWNWKVMSAAVVLATIALQSAADWRRARRAREAVASIDAVVEMTPQLRARVYVALLMAMGGSWDLDKAVRTCMVALEDAFGESRDPGKRALAAAVIKELVRIGPGLGGAGLVPSQVLIGVMIQCYRQYRSAALDIAMDTDAGADLTEDLLQVWNEWGVAAVAIGLSILAAENGGGDFRPPAAVRVVANMVAEPLCALAESGRLEAGFRPLIIPPGGRLFDYMAHVAAKEGRHYDAAFWLHKIIKVDLETSPADSAIYAGRFIVQLCTIIDKRAEARGQSLEDIPADDANTDADAGPDPANPDTDHANLGPDADKPGPNAGNPIPDADQPSPDAGTPDPDPDHPSPNPDANTPNPSPGQQDTPPAGDLKSMAAVAAAASPDLVKADDRSMLACIKTCTEHALPLLWEHGGSVGEDGLAPDPRAREALAWCLWARARLGLRSARSRPERVAARNAATDAWQIGQELALGGEQVARFRATLDQATRAIRAAGDEPPSEEGGENGPDV